MVSGEWRSNEASVLKIIAFSLGLFDTPLMEQLVHNLTLWKTSCWGCQGHFLGLDGRSVCDLPVSEQSPKVGANCSIRGVRVPDKPRLVALEAVFHGPSLKVLEFLENLKTMSGFSSRPLRS